MSITVEIPGGTATLRDPDELTVGQRRKIMAVSISNKRLAAKVQASDEATFEGSDLTLDESMRVLSVADTLLLVFLKEWTLTDPIPTAETIDDMNAALYDAISEACAPLWAKANGADFTPDGSPDPTSPTGPSAP